MKFIHPLSVVILFITIILVGIIRSNVPLSLIILIIGILSAFLITAYTIPRLLPENIPETFLIRDEETTGAALTRLETLLTGKTFDVITWDSHHYENVGLDPSVSPQISMERGGKSLTISLTGLTVTTTDFIVIDGNTIAVYNSNFSGKKPYFLFTMKGTK